MRSVSTTDNSVDWSDEVNMKSFKSVDSTLTGHELLITGVDRDQSKGAIAK